MFQAAQMYKNNMDYGRVPRAISDKGVQCDGDGFPDLPEIPDLPDIPDIPDLPDFPGCRGRHKKLPPHARYVREISYFCNL